MNLTNEDVQEILQLLDASSFDVLQLQTERFKLTLRRRSDANWSQESRILSAPNLIQAAPSASLVAPNAESQPAAARVGLTEILTSLPGTFYRAPKPGALPFVVIGSRVDKDTVVGIIETMKLMNAVHAGACGEIVEICFENAQFAEPGSVLMRIEPGAS